ncbi:hypothetical protein NDR89_19995 [Cupriavidus gilardii]|uniref:RepB family plasmid replication initiator protein n=1 Tax=Cupriavidus gilardii TaxID=82541 RepID=A0ABY4VPI2_9BURK|nr:hypothetical protein [Cupriavidus gilardii]USE78920.1 hypothetical protein NDR89_19995 [Cupriavidus gilardii]
MRNAVFADTRQALYVAHMVMALPPRQGSPFRTSLIRMLEGAPRLSATQSDWLEQLRGQPGDSTVNFSGLTSDEVRGQCAMVVSTVDSKLPAPERAVIRARFVPAEYEEMVRGDKYSRRFFYSRERVEAIGYLGDWLAPTVTAVSRDALDFLVAKVFANHQKLVISYRHLADQFGGNHMTYARAFATVRDRMRELEAVAVDRLTPYFEASGLIERAEAAA